MARIKGGLNAKKKHNRVLKLAKGYRGARSKQYRVAKQSVMRALTSFSCSSSLSYKYGNTFFMLFTLVESTTVDFLRFLFLF